MRNKGFTLIEILVVIAIISIIAAFMMPNLLGVKDRAKEAGVRAVMRSIQLAVESFNLENSYYPQGDNITLRQLCDDYLIDPGYVGSVPKNTFTGKEYTNIDVAGRVLYFYDDNKGSYKLVGYKRDGSRVLMELTNM